MRRLRALLIATALVAITAGTAAAVQYPPGPGGGCPDTLTLVNIQNPSALCHPASGDTANGITGIVTGFDKDFSPYAVWIQLQSGGQWTGVQVFTGATNYFSAVPGTPTGGNIALGDNIVVYGRSLEFNGVTEFTDYDNVQSTNDIIIRRLSAGNAQPPYQIGTPGQFDWVPTKSAATAEPYEGCLVKIRGPLVVGRNAGPGVGSRSFLVTGAGGSTPGDSAAVDGFTLTNVAALAVGTVVDSVQGIMHQTIINSISSYRILLRGAEDLFAAAPPNVIDAYPIEDNIIRVAFDRDVTEASAENTANYSLGSFGSVDAAVLEGGAGRFVRLTVTNGLSDGDNESVTASGVVSTSGLPMASPQNRTFINGVLTLATVQAPDPAQLGGACDDRSRFTGANGTSGARLSYRGIVTASFGSVYYLSDPGSGVRAGMPVFGSPVPLTVGRQYLIAGQVQEFDGISTSIPDGLTEGVTSVFAQDEGPATIPAPIVQSIAVLSDTTCDATQSALTAEDYEGVLVQVKYARITENRLAGESFIIAGPNGSPLDTMLISNSNNAYSFKPDSNHLVTITGVLTFRNGGFPFRILPRSNADIQDFGALAVPPADGGGNALSFSVHPNPARVATFSFTLPQAADVELGVYDITGRKLVDVVKGSFPAGPFTQTWNGRGADGARLQPGMYFYRLKAGGQMLTQRGVFLK